MKAFNGKNHYEKAFQCWLGENKARFVVIDQAKRAAFAKVKIKSFDFIVSADDGKLCLTEVKGRKFKGTTLENKSAMQCWVTMDDVNGLSAWQEIFGPDYTAVFVFAYDIETPDIDADDVEIFEFEGRHYCFYLISLADYKKFMVLRSPKWQTVTLLTEDFKSCARQAKYLLCLKDANERQD